LEFTLINNSCWIPSSFSTILIFLDCQKTRHKAAIDVGGSAYMHTELILVCLFNFCKINSFFEYLVSPIRILFLQQALHILLSQGIGYGIGGCALYYSAVSFR
jgi:hypothetical protein